MATIKSVKELSKPGRIIVMMTVTMANEVYCYKLSRFEIRTIKSVSFGNTA